MRILVVTHENDLSGANKSLLSIIKGLKNKVDFTVLVNEKNGKLTDELRKLNIDTLYYPYTWWYAHNRSSSLKKIYRKLIETSIFYIHRYLSKRFIRILESKNFDMVYTNTSTVDVGIRIANSLHLPHIWHIREFGEEDFGFQYIKNKNFYRKRFNETEYMIVISEALKNKYKNFVDEEKIRVIYNGFNIDDLFIDITRKKVDMDPVKILVTGQVSEAKCTHHAIYACKKLVDEGINLKLNIAGTIDEDYIKKTVPNVKDYKWCNFLGQVENIKKLREKTNLELICSKNEAFGRVTIEAMLAGLPVIGANTGGTKELIENDKTGLLYKFGDVDDLALKIRELISNNNKYRTISLNAQEYAKTFTIDRTCKLVLSEFDKVMNANEY